ncbi:unnamed protein product [Porites evermanni]|uniref:Uncharacterized protein n=1 Tax=Porites evermanni TaxID=104178 RepID=A0ABN8SQD1_9CNID|nr:unnamed protein product [Porites evermanni]
MRHIIVYRPPYSSLHPVSASVFFDEFSQFLENVKFMDLLDTFSLSQQVSGPTHLSGHTLDLIITRSSDDVCPIGFPRPTLSCKELTFRKLKNIDIAEFLADIASSMFCASVHWDNIDALSDCFNTTLNGHFGQACPA